MVDTSVTTYIKTKLITALFSIQECPLACPYNLDPVCGSDGQSYANFCIFISAQCELENEGEWSVCSDEVGRHVKGRYQCFVHLYRCHHHQRNFTTAIAAFIGTYHCQRV